MRVFKRIAPFDLVSCAVVAGVLVSGALAGCSSPPEVKYYSLRGDEAVTRKVAVQDKLAANEPARGAPVVLVDHFAIDEAYAGERMAYRQGQYQLGYDPYSLWAGSPAAQVEDSVRDQLWVSCFFSEVRQPAPVGPARDADLIVTGRISRLEEIDRDDEWRAALDLELYLLDGKTRAVLVSRRYSKIEAAAKRNPGAVAERLAWLLSDDVGKFLSDARGAIEAHKRGGS